MGIAGKSSVLWDCPVYSNSFNDLVYQFLYRLSPECPKAGDDSLTDGQTQDADVFEDSAGVWTEAKEPSYLLGSQMNSKVQGKVEVVEVIFLLRDNKVERCLFIAFLLTLTQLIPVSIQNEDRMNVDFYWMKFRLEGRISHE